MSKKIVQVIPITHVPLPKDQIYTYTLPQKFEKKAKKGQLVIVSFRNKERQGIIVKIPNPKSQIPKYELKSIIRIVDEIPVMSVEQIKLASWISEYYHAPLGVVIKRMIPKIIKKNPKSKIQNPKLDLKKPRLHLTEAEQKIVNIINILNAPNVFLLHDQKAEFEKINIYLHLLSKVVSKGKQAMVLVPEISFAPKLVQKFVNYFGQSNLAVTHSGLSLGQRYREWLRIRSGQAKIIIGPRSAIFAPARKLGLIIVDQEYDPSYKQWDQTPRYEARKVAIELAKLTKSKIILSSTTPSINSYYQAKKGKYKLLELDKKLSQISRLQIIDMREELRKGNRSIFSEELFKGIKKNLANKKQVVLFINRRGLATFVLCRDCGYIEKCPNCNIPLTYHTTPSPVLICHHCGYTKTLPTACPKCKGYNIKYFGGGTEKVELEIKKLFPKAKISRLDIDQVSTKKEYTKIYNDFTKNRVDILIGTQMINETWDFSKAGILGIISADINLNLPDFRAGERTFQLLSRLIRQTSKSQVIIQTYNPDHPAIKSAVQDDYRSFYNQEVKARKELSYPPLSQMINLIYLDENQDKAKKEAQDLARILKRRVKQLKMDKQIIIFGPTPAFVYRIRNRYCWHIIVKIKNPAFAKAYSFVKTTKDESAGKQKSPKGKPTGQANVKNKLLNLVPDKWKVDVDPESLL